MPSALRYLGSRLAATVKGFTVAQRTIAVIGIAVLVVASIAAASLLGRATYAPLFTGLAATDASSITDQLKTEGIPYQLTDGGATILVPQDQVYAARLKAASANLPADNQGGYSLLDKMGVTASEFQENVTYKRAIEGELAKTIEAMDGVQTASVQLAIPDKSVFVSETKDPTASVFVATKAGVTLTDEQVQAIVHLTSAAVEGMQPADVSVVDAKGDVLSTVGGTSVGGADSQTTDYDTRVHDSIQALLDKVVGPGNSSVVVQASLDPQSGTRTSESYAQPTSGPIALDESSTTESYGTGTGSGTSATGVLGPDNIAVPNSTVTNQGTGATTATGANGYGNTSVTKNNAVDKTTQTMTIPAGAVTKQSVSVAIDRKAAASVNMSSLSNLVRTAAGIDTTRGDAFQISVVPFNQDAAKQAQSALRASAQSAAQEALFSTLKTAGIALAIALVLIVGFVILSRRARQQEREDVDLGELDSFAAGFPMPLAVDGQAGREALGSTSSPVLGAAGATPVLGAPATVPAPAAPAAAFAAETTGAADRSRIVALAEQDPDRTAELLRSLLDDRTGA